MRVWVRVHVVIDLKQHIICGQLSSYPFSFCSALLKHNSPHHFLCSIYVLTSVVKDTQDMRLRNATTMT